MFLHISSFLKFARQSYSPILFFCFRFPRSKCILPYSRAFPDPSSLFLPFSTRRSSIAFYHSLHINICFVEENCIVSNIPALLTPLPSRALARPRLSTGIGFCSFAFLLCYAVENICWLFLSSLLLFLLPWFHFVMCVCYFCFSITSVFALLKQSKQSFFSSFLIRVKRAHNNNSSAAKSPPERALSSRVELKFRNCWPFISLIPPISPGNKPQHYIANFR